MKHLVTGSAGFLGTHLMRALGDDAVGCDLPNHDILEPYGDYPEESAPYQRQFYENEPETVWHLAALNDATQTFYDRPWDVLNTQIRGTLNVIDACVANVVKTLVLFSSSEVYQTPPVIPTPEDVPLVVPDLKNPRYSYGGGKLAAELLCWHSKIPRVLIVRPHNIFGEGQGPGHVIPDTIRRCLDAEPEATLTIPGHEQSVRAYCYVGDFIQDCLEIVKHHAADERTREVYHLGSENHYALSGLVERIAHACGRDDLSFVYGENPPGSTMLRRPDLSKMQAIGWLPSSGGIGPGLAKTIAWHREQAK